MKIYNVVVDDRHADLEVIPFVDKSEAILYALKCAKFGSEHNGDYWEVLNSGVACWWVQYSCEGSSVKVLEQEVCRKEYPVRVLGKIVPSMTYGNLVSIRDAGGRGIRDALTDAGFKPGDEVVILLQKDFEAMTDGY